MSMRGTPRRFGPVLTLIFVCALTPSAEQRASSQADVERDLGVAERLRKDRKESEAATAFQAVIDAAHSLGLDAEEAKAQCGLGETLTHLAQYARARTVLHHCLDLAERMHSEEVIGRASLALSNNAELTGQSADAKSFAERAVAAYDAAQNPRGRAFARLEQLRVGGVSPEEGPATL